METRQQTKTTDQNRDLFYRRVYHHQTADRSQLVELDRLTEKSIVMIDCCGWHYKNLFPEKTVIGLETISTVKQFKLDRMYFDKIVDDQNSNRVGLPSLDLDECAVIFDRSPILKYCSLEKIKTILNEVAVKYRPSTIILNQSLMFTDDSRIADRFYELAKLSVSGYFVKDFEYTTETDHWYIKFQRKLCYND